VPAGAKPAIQCTVCTVRLDINNSDVGRKPCAETAAVTGSTFIAVVASVQIRSACIKRARYLAMIDIRVKAFAKGPGFLALSRQRTCRPTSTPLAKRDRLAYTPLVWRRMPIPGNSHVAKQE
jgi:hypothetical protein